MVSLMKRNSNCDNTTCDTSNCEKNQMGKKIKLLQAKNYNKLFGKTTGQQRSLLQSCNVLFKVFLPALIKGLFFKALILILVKVLEL